LPVGTYRRENRTMTTSDHARHDADDHTHVHGEGCGHDSVQHGDHLDYVHDGHLHAEHAGHYDEHEDDAG
jgi:hypothetical protein